MDKKKRKYILSNISNYLHVHTIFTLLPGRSTSSSCPPYTTRTADLGKAEPRFEDSQCTNGSMSHFWIVTWCTFCAGVCSQNSEAQHRRGSGERGGYNFEWEFKEFRKVCNWPCSEVFRSALLSEFWPARYAQCSSTVALWRRCSIGVWPDHVFITSTSSPDARNSHWPKDYLWIDASFTWWTPGISSAFCLMLIACQVLCSAGTVLCLFVKFQLISGFPDPLKWHTAYFSFRTCQGCMGAQRHR